MGAAGDGVMAAHLPVKDLRRASAAENEEGCGFDLAVLGGFEEGWWGDVDG